MNRRVLFWCAASAALTATMIAVIIYAIVRDSRLAVPAIPTMFAASLLLRQVLALFVARRPITEADRDSFAGDIVKGGAWGLILLLVGVGLMVIVFGSDATGLIVGYVVLIIVGAAVVVGSLRSLDSVPIKPADDAE